MIVLLKRNKDKWLPAKWLNGGTWMYREWYDRATWAKTNDEVATGIGIGKGLDAAQDLQLIMGPYPLDTEKLSRPITFRICLEDNPILHDKKLWEYAPTSQHYAVRKTSTSYANETRIKIFRPATDAEIKMFAERLPIEEHRKKAVSAHYNWLDKLRREGKYHVDQPF